VEATTPADDGGSDDDDDDGDGVFDPSTVCLEAAAAMAAAIQVYTMSFSGAFDDAATADVEDDLEEWAANAPEEIKDDFVVYATEMSAYYEALGEIGLTAGATPTAEQLQALSEAADQVDQEAIDEASANINAWFDANC
jgi:hypothetical protein